MTSKSGGTVVALEANAALEATADKLINTLNMVQRVSARLEDLVKHEFDQLGRLDVNATQALLLFRIGDKEMMAGQLRTDGIYLGSNVSYNITKLRDLGYLDHQRSRVDRRSVRIKLTDKGQQVRRIVEQLFVKHARLLAPSGDIRDEDLDRLVTYMQKLDRFFHQSIMYQF